jgi:transcriptional regulator with XRE-family HTH domain
MSSRWFMHLPALSPECGTGRGRMHGLGRRGESRVQRTKADLHALLPGKSRPSSDSAACIWPQEILDLGLRLVIHRARSVKRRSLPALNNGSGANRHFLVQVAPHFGELVMTAISETQIAILASGHSDDSYSGAKFPTKVEDASDSKHAIGERIKQARLQSGLQQLEVAERCGVSRAAVSNWENGLGIKSLNLIEYARVVGVPAEWLITGGRTAASARMSSADLDPMQLQRLIAASFQLLGKTPGQAEEWSKAILKASERPQDADQEAHEPALTQRLARFLMRMYGS